MGHLHHKLISIQSFIISFLLFIQMFLFYFMTDHKLYHIGHSFLIIMSLAFFLMGYFYKITQLKEWLFMLLLPLLYGSIVLKALWTGGLYSPFLLWVFILPFQVSYWAYAKFFKFFAAFLLMLSVGSLLYFIKLDQMNFAHTIFNLSSMNYIILYLIPFCSLSFFFIYDALKFNQYYQFQKSFSLPRNKLVHYIKLLFDIDVSIESLSDNKFKLSGPLDRSMGDLVYHLNELDYSLENHYEGSEKVEMIFSHASNIVAE